MFQLTCLIDPGPGQPCPVDSVVWVQPIPWQQSAWDFLMMAPDLQLVSTAMGITIAIVTAFAWPVIVGKIVDGTVKASGIRV